MNKNSEKVNKNVELVSTLATELEEMGVGERIRVTPLAKRICMANGSHPHVDTIKGKLMEAYLWQDVTQRLAFYKKDGIILEVERLPDKKVSEVDILIKTELRGDLNILKNKVDTLEQNLQDLKKSVDSNNRNYIILIAKIDRIIQRMKL